MKIDKALLLYVGYDFSKDLYIASFRVGFHLIHDNDLISEFPGYDPLEELANEKIDEWISQQVGKTVDLEESEDDDVSYELRDPALSNSWGSIAWTVKRYYQPEALEGARNILSHWERAVRLVQLKSSLKEQDQPIVWADELDLLHTKEA